MLRRGRLEAAIWDMDGVIVDTAPYHFGAWREVFQKRGVSFDGEDFKRNFGQRNDAIIKNILGEKVSTSEIAVIASEKEENYRRRARGKVRPLPGAMELLKLLGENRVKIAMASSTPVENIELVNQSLGISDCFHAIVFGEEVTEGKPSPQAFLLAAKKLGVEPTNCIVIEDAVAGVAAAKSAGMKCLAVTNTHPKINLLEADLIVDTLEAVSLEDLAALFNSTGKD